MIGEDTIDQVMRKTNTRRLIRTIKNWPVLHRDHSPRRKNQEITFCSHQIVLIGRLNALFASLNEKQKSQAKVEFSKCRRCRLRDGKNRNAASFDTTQIVRDERLIHRQSIQVGGPIGPSESGETAHLPCPFLNTELLAELGPELESSIASQGVSMPHRLVPSVLLVRTENLQSHASEKTRNALSTDGKRLMPAPWQAESGDEV
ncbi:MAG: hypothetical protein AAFU56_10065 [Pseudomonadota bacterium]